MYILALIAVAGAAGLAAWFYVNSGQGAKANEQGEQAGSYIPPANPPAYSEGNVSPNPTSKVSAIADAIERAEGYGVVGTTPTRANNPGDLCVGDLGYGVIVSTGGEKITVFDTYAHGRQALEHQVTLMVTNASANYNTSMTWSEIGAKYAGDQAWAHNVANALGVSVNSTLGDYLAS
jgi:hypothetical protein